MKNFFTIFIGISFILMIVACATTTAATTHAPAQPALSAEAQARADSGRSVNSGFPKFVKDAVIKCPEDALVGVGSARLATLSQSRTVAATRARADLSRQMNTMIQDMVVDYQAGSELDHSAALAFQENFTMALSKSTLVGSVTADEDMDANNNYWMVIYLSKANVVNEINQAQAAAKLAVPAAAAFDANRRMDNAFNKALSSEVIGVDK